MAPFTKLRKMQVPCIKPLAIDDSNKVDDSTNALIVMVEGQDIPNEVMPLDASIDPSRLMVEGEDLQSADTNKAPPFFNQNIFIYKSFSTTFQLQFFII